MAAPIYWGPRAKFLKWILFKHNFELYPFDRELFSDISYIVVGGCGSVVIEKANIASERGNEAIELINKLRQTNFMGMDGRADGPTKRGIGSRSTQL